MGDIMKNYFSSMSEETRNTVLISGIVLIIIVLFFILTFIRLNQPYKIMVPPLYSDNSIQYDEILIGSALAMPEERYFVFISNNDSTSPYYENLVASSDLGYRYYKANLDSFLNQGFYASESNRDDLKISGNTILFIENGEIKEFLETIDEVTSYFSN